MKVFRAIIRGVINLSDYKGQVAVITGAASGLGRGISLRCADMGMKLSLADIDSANLEAFEKELKVRGVEVISSVVNVTDYDQFEAFASKTINHYGVVNMFFNNAGVSAPGNVWTQPLKDWRWVFDVNFFGQVHGIKAFVPFMIKQDIECSIINTASAAGLLISVSSPVYGCSKHAAVALSEFLNLQLQTEKTKVKAFVFCPGFVATNIHKSGEKRPADTLDPKDEAYYKSEEYFARAKTSEANVTVGISVEEAVNILFKGMEEDKFYIITHPGYREKIDARNSNIIAGRRPIAG
jgi:NADP-dependent 3-hydroxy acid dehydrogenase YdfG